VREMMSQNNIQSWNIQDPMPGAVVGAIEPISCRALVLMIRNRQSPILAGGFGNVAGAIEMMAGLDYHHDNFARITSSLADGVPLDQIDQTTLNHEAVAYINRLGQFQAFARSPLVKSVAPDALDRMPTIDSLMVFRNKHTAHRSMDRPWDDDTDDLQWVHARSLAQFGGRMWVPRPGVPQPSAANLKTYEDLMAHKTRLWRSGYVSYQIFDADKNDTVDFAIERDHPTVMSEAYALIERLILSSGAVAAE
jgi:hypothetical protein